MKNFFGYIFLGVGIGIFYNIFSNKINSFLPWIIAFAFSGAGLEMIITSFIDKAKKESAGELKQEINELKNEIENIKNDSNNKENYSDDELYEKAKKIVLDLKKVSTSYLQRKLNLGYVKSAQLMDLLEQRGVIGPANGAEPREVLEK